MFCFEQVPEQSMNVNTETEVELTAEKTFKHHNLSLSIINAQKISHSLKFWVGFKLTKFPPSGSKWTAMFSQSPLRSPD